MTEKKKFSKLRLSKGKSYVCSMRKNAKKEKNSTCAGSSKQRRWSYSLVRCARIARYQLQSRLFGAKKLKIILNVYEYFFPRVLICLHTNGSMRCATCIR